MRGYLKDRIGGRVDNPCAALHVFVAVSIDHRRSTPGDVTDHGPPCCPTERVDDRRRKSIRIRRERLIEVEPGKLPVTGGRVLPGRRRVHDTERRTRRYVSTHASD